VTTWSSPPKCHRRTASGRPAKNTASA
jgi:hypothetical protein